MKIRYYGHAWFSFEAACGFTVTGDPYDPGLGYPERKIRADAVTVSHGHHDHAYVQGVVGSQALCDDCQCYELPGAVIRGFPSFHDEERGQKRGNNILFLLEMDGLRVLHCGDLGHELSEDTLAALGRVDILLIPVGGYYTIGAARAAAVTRRIRPKIAIPMHYQTLATASMPIATQEEYLRLMGAAKRAAIPALCVTADSLPQATDVVVLAY